MVHPTMVSVLLSALVERCFVSRMRDFFLYVVIVIVVDFPQEKLDDLDIPLRTQVMSKRTNTRTE